MPEARPFVGREREREALKRVLGRLAGKAAQAVAVTGEPGIGKTSLLGFLARIAGERGLAVLAGTGREPARRMPFGLLIEAMDDYLAALPSRRLNRLGSDHLGALGMIFPSLARYRPGSADRVLRAERYRLHAAVRALLEELGPAGLTVTLDDLHWADEESAEVAVHLLRRPPRTGVLLAFAYRDRQAPEWLRAAIAQTAADRAIELIKLGPLSAEEADLLLGQQGTQHQRDILYRESGGNPFYLQALAMPSGLSELGGGDDSELPADVSAALLAELAALSPATRSLTEAAAVAGEPFDPGYLAEIAGLGYDEVRAAVDELASRDLIRPTRPPRSFTFRHPLVREVVYRSSPPAWRLAAHERAAASLERSGASTAARAHHVAITARRGDLAAVELLVSAAREARFHAPATAAEWLRAALLLLPGDSRDSPQATALLLYRGAALGMAGHPLESRDTMHEVLRLLSADQAGLRAKAVAFCALMDRALGRWGEAQALLTSELTALSDQQVTEAVTLRFELACGELFGGEAVVARDWAAQALATVGERETRALRAAVLGVTAIAEAFCEDTAVAASCLGEAVPLLDSLLDSELGSRIDAAGWVGLAEIFADRPRDALRHLERGLDVARSTGQGMVLSYLLAVRVLALRSVGRLTDASACASDALDLALTTGSEEQRGFAIAMQCWVTSATGDLDEALRLGNAAADRHDPGARGWAAGLGLRMLAETRFAVGDPEGCLALVPLAGGPTLPRADPWSRVGWYELLTQAELAAGNRSAATRWAARAESAAARLKLPGRTGLALLAQAHVRAAENPAHALEPARAAGHALTEAGLILDASRARLTAGRALAARGETDRAVAELKQAQAAFQAIGARHLTRQAVTERRRVSARAARPRTGVARAGTGAGIGTLTRREHQIALLVAEGMTNRRIARQLQVTEKTVETHLSNIFAKLAVSSRTALASAIARRAEQGQG